MRVYRLRITLVERHLAYLKDRGFIYNFEDREVKLLAAGGKRSPPTLLFTEVVRALQQRVLEEEPRLAPAQIRRKISPLLAPVFGTEAADPRAKGRLDQACYRAL